MREETSSKLKRALLAVAVWIISFFVVASFASGQETDEPNSTITGDMTSSMELARYEQEFSSASIKPAHLGQNHGIAVIFEGTDDLHYYAKPETATAPGFELKVTAGSDDFEFGKAIFPKWSTFTDPFGKQVEVYVGNFTIFIPIKTIKESTKSTGQVDVTITGQACTSDICLLPFEQTLRTNIDWNTRDSWAKVDMEVPAGRDITAQKVTQPAWFALILAFLAGLALNIMPCVWPVLPLIVMRIVGQAKQSRGVSTALGLSFCLGILLFFALLAGANIVLKIFYGTVLQWGDQLRNPTFVAGMSLLLVLLALFMFGVFTITVPSAISSKQTSGKGYIASVGMGFLAAILGTPCSFGILAAAFAWAQSQALLPATIAIMVIGIGMALPYAILTSMPGLLNRLPKPGKWMELFKQGIGFVLLIIAVKLITAMPESRISGVLYFAVVLAFCTWMWGTWVSFGTKPVRKLLVRIMAIAVALGAGWVFLPASADELIDWQSYDAQAIQTAIENERPVLIKFTAAWCLSCHTVERTVYSRKDIAKLIEQKNVLAIKADTTEKDFPATIALQQTYNEPGVPVSMLFVPGYEEPLRWRGILFARELKKQLEKLETPKVTKVRSD
jgi:thiol:disulfide interchange protein